MSVFCKHCGRKFSDIRSLVTGGACSRSPTDKHEPFEGDASGKITCKYCGRTSSNISSLVTGGACSRSPTDKHEPFEG